MLKLRSEKGEIEWEFVLIVVFITIILLGLMYLYTQSDKSYACRTIQDEKLRTECIT